MDAEVIAALSGTALGGGLGYLGQWLTQRWTKGEDTKARARAASAELVTAAQLYIGTWTKMNAWVRKPSTLHDQTALYQELLARNTAVMTSVSLCGLLCPDEMFAEIFEVRDQVVKTMTKVIDTTTDDAMKPVQQAIDQLINMSRKYLNK